MLDAADLEDEEYEDELVLEEWLSQFGIYPLSPRIALPKNT